MKKTIISCFICTTLLIITSAFAIAQPGTLDITFGVQGKIFEDNKRGEANTIAIQKDGKIVTGGHFYSGYQIEDANIVIARFNSDASVDNDFGEGGRFILNDGDGSRATSLQNIFIQKDGKILAAGRFMTGNGSINADIALIRLNKDGKADSSFGGNGVIIVKLSPYYDMLGEMALQEDGKILVAGLKGVQNPNLNSAIPFLMRLNNDGSYDESFGDSGIVIQGFNDHYVNISSIIQLPNGKIIMGGDDDGLYQYQAVMFKYNADGILDESFGNNGIAESRFLNTQKEGDIVGHITDLLLLPDGKILACGNSPYSRFLISKFNADGSTDTSFGQNRGYTIFNQIPTYSRVKQAFITKGNKVFVTGSFGFSVYRFLENGSFDTSFGNDGISTSAFDVPCNIGTRGAAIQADGKIILAGSGANRNDDFYHLCMLRLHGDGGIDAGGYVKIKKWMKKNGFSWWPGMVMKKPGSYNVQRSADGVNFTTVASVNKTMPGSNNEYSYEDPSPAKGTNYYRLVYTNTAGKNVYSNVIAIEEVAAVHIYPNPVTNYINIAGINGKTKLYITDISGTVKMVTNTTGKNFNWNVAALHKGYYILKIETEGKEAVIKKFYKE